LIHDHYNIYWFYKKLELAATVKQANVVLGSKSVIHQHIKSGIQTEVPDSNKYFTWCINVSVLEEITACCEEQMVRYNKMYLASIYFSEFFQGQKKLCKQLNKYNALYSIAVPVTAVIINITCVFVGTPQRHKLSIKLHSVVCYTPINVMHVIQLSGILWTL